MAKYISDFRQGNTKRLKITYPNSIVGYQFRIRLFTEFGGSPVIEVTTTAGDDAADIPDEGLCYIEMSSTDTLSVPAGKYYYSLDRIIPGAPDDVYTIMPPIKEYKDKVLVVEGNA